MKVFEELKTFSIIYNPIATKFKPEIIESIICKFVSKGMKFLRAVKSEYAGHVIPLIKELDPESDLLITVGGDGTVSEAFRAFYQMEIQHCVYTHISTGTTNDMANNFGLCRKNALKSVDRLLDGHVCEMDSFTVNGEPVSYVSAFGYVAPIPYLADGKLKKALGHMAYVVSAVPILLSKPEKFNMTYEFDGETKNGDFTMVLISNSKGMGGINLYRNVDMNDGKFEVFLVKMINPEIIKTVFPQYLRDKVDLRCLGEYTESFSTSELKIRFNDNTPKHEVDNDGNKATFTYAGSNNELHYKTGKKITILLPKSETR